MTAYELHDLLSSNRELISDTWNYFLTVHLAIFGIVYIASGHIRMIERLILVCGYFAFMGVNYMAQIDNYANHERIKDQIRLLGDESAQALLLAVDKVWISDYILHIYGAAAFISSIVIIMINRGDG